MAYYGAVDVLDYGVEKKQKKDGEYDVAMEASNGNSPFAWVQGKAPRSPAEGGGAAVTSYSPVPLSSPVGVDKAAMKSPGGAIVETPSSTGPGSQWKAIQGKEYGAGDYPADPYANALRIQRGGANENLKVGPQSMNDFDEEKKKRVAAFLDGYAPARGASVSLGLG